MTEATPCSAVPLRDETQAPDRDAVRRIVESTGYFAPYEVDVAVELVDERLAKGLASGYYFLFAEREGETIGYACYGPIACTRHSYDLYWIAVDAAHQRSGWGRRLLAASEQRIRQAGGQRIYIETSNRAQYATTRAFYERCGYVCEAVLRDFYAPGDDKVIYVRALGGSS